MSELFLTIPTKEDLPAVDEFKQEFFAVGETVINGGALLDRLNLPDWLDLLRKNSKPETVSENWVLSSTFLAKRKFDNTIVGIIDVRHNLGTSFLAAYGGRIGYAVRPSEREQGYAKEMLTQAIDFSRSLGIAELMLGCYADNHASIGVIKTCGGTLQETKLYEDGKPMVIYTINATAATL